MSICHCLSVKKRVSVKNVKILEMSDFGNTARMREVGQRTSFILSSQQTLVTPFLSFPANPCKNDHYSAGSRVVYLHPYPVIV